MLQLRMHARPQADFCRPGAISLMHVDFLLAQELAEAALTYSQALSAQKAGKLDIQEQQLAADGGEWPAQSQKCVLLHAAPVLQLLHALS